MSDKKDDCFKCRLREIKAAHFFTMLFCFALAALVPAVIIFVEWFDLDKSVNTNTVIGAIISAFLGWVSGLATSGFGLWLQTKPKNLLRK